MDKVEIKIGNHKYYFDHGITVEKAKAIASLPKEIDFIIDNKIMENNEKIYPNLNIKVRYNINKNGKCDC